MTDIIIAGIARALFVSAWMEREEEAGRTYPQQDINEVAPATPPEVLLEAYRLTGHIEAANGMSLICIFAAADKAEHPDSDFTDAGHPHLRLFGWYLGMQAIGHGVAWTDDHTAFGYKSPRWEFNLDPLETDNIDAEVHTDNRRREVSFNAVAWFRQASIEEIKALRDDDWGTSEAADDVAEFFSDTNTEVRALFGYLYENRLDLPEDFSGFECTVNKEQALAWLEKHRNDAYLAVRPWFVNSYVCPRCSHEWNDEFSSGSDDECPKCGAENISPEESVQVEYAR